MKKTFTLVTLLLLACLTMGFGSCGTVKVPSNSILFESPHGKLSLSHPQNTDMTNVVVEIQTNGTVKAQIGSLHTVNDPQVIKTTADGQAQIVKATSDGIALNIKAASDAAGNLSGAAAKKFVAPVP